MGAGWKHAGKMEKAASKGALVNKIAKEIQVASKLGGPDPEHNARLRAAVELARKNSVTRDTIERAIKKGAGLLDDGTQLENVTYEGFAPHKVPVIVECLTNNRSRTNSEIRILFRDGQMGNPGSVGWMFDHMGIIEASHKDPKVDFEGAAIEAGAQNVELLEKEETTAGTCGARFFSDPTDLDTVSKGIAAAGWTISKSELGYVPKNYPELTPDQTKQVVEFLQEIDDFEDVHRVYTAMR